MRAETDVRQMNSNIQGGCVMLMRYIAAFSILKKFAACILLRLEFIPKHAK